MVSGEVETALMGLDELNKAHLSVAGYVLQADGGALFPVDLVAQAVLHRSMALLRGFSGAIRDENFLCAAPLIRLQLDNLLRFYALFIVEDPHETSMQMFKGVPLRKQRDKKGSKMTDAYLAKKLSAELPWIPEVYKQTSGYIHLSEKHMFNTHGDVDESTRSVEICISGKDFKIDDGFRIEAIDCMKETTSNILRYIYGWGRTKDVVGAKRNAGDST